MQSTPAANGLAHGRPESRVDWSIVLLVLGFAASVLPVVWVAWGRIVLASLSPMPPFAEYETAIREAAVKKTAFEMPVHAIAKGAEKVVVTTFRYPSLKPGKQSLPDHTWVSIPEELQEACKGAAQPVRLLQEVLGLPVTKADRAVYKIAVAREDLIRPCMSTGDVGASVCSVRLPEPPALPPKTASAEDRLKVIEPAWEHLDLMARQMWNSYRTGVARSRVGAGDYPYDGYPFTGMGWSYNWNPTRNSPFGVAEFVIRKNAEIDILETIDPAVFCKAKTP